eukprot:CAMPEP_0197665040 /NCGR_PEP_ID=MMETSP1338-20131121/59000_1 /TAXON_ID=43686 ORGANISM="Pelagodinium beii, Strain RCC1491" /NCGR_SAMPLE_ID=MMETSP1338 /ASSEMBLY_ACC=CAM_ASM_000754 /LENGTH=299 /DNA_ID=CAMNT_0043243791 /DNA_START=105 /DNA_END=1004 /DNA_ORIENTATION=+
MAQMKDEVTKDHAAVEGVEELLMQAIGSQEPVLKRPKSDEDVLREEEVALPPDAMYLSRTPSAGSHAAQDVVSDRRIMGAAATLGGTAGMMLLGPVSGAALGAAALYATTREDSAGAMARKAGSVYLHVADRAVDEGLRALDVGMTKVGKAVDEGTRHLETSGRLPGLVRNGLQKVRTTQSGPANGNRQVSSEDAAKIRQKFPDRVPIICTRSAYADLPELSKNKFVLPGSMLCGEFKYIVHKQLAEATAGPGNAARTIYLFVNGVTPKTSTPMSELYDQFRGEDGFLYITYGAENTLG